MSTPPREDVEDVSRHRVFLAGHKLREGYRETCPSKYCIYEVEYNNDYGHYVIKNSKGTVVTNDSDWITSLQDVMNYLSDTPATHVVISDATEDAATCYACQLDRNVLPL